MEGGKGRGGGREGGRERESIVDALLYLPYAQGGMPVLNSIQTASLLQRY